MSLSIYISNSYIMGCGTQLLSNRTCWNVSAAPCKGNSNGFRFPFLSYRPFNLRVLSLLLVRDTHALHTQCVRELSGSLLSGGEICSLYPRHQMTPEQPPPHGKATCQEREEESDRFLRTSPELLVFACLMGFCIKIHTLLLSRGSCVCVAMARV